MHISDDTLSLSRASYSNARDEKLSRAAFSSAVKRALDQDTIVIADGMNYIKGFRYQLYCEAKAVRTTNCVVQVGTPEAKCREFNEEALRIAGGAEAQDSPPYPPEVFENLLYRYEEPNGMARWDAPLFAVPFDDAAPDCDAIWEALVGSDGNGSGQTKAVRPNAATVLKPAAEQGYLYELDRATSEVIGAVMGWAGDHPGEGGGRVHVGGGNGGGKVDKGGNGDDEDEEKDEGQVVCLPMTPPTLAQLQRLRRQFIALNRQHDLSKARVKGLFVDYLNDAFGNQ